MKIARHAIDLQRAEYLFHLECDALASSLPLARESVRVLSSVVSNAKFVYLTGSVIAADSVEVANAIRVGAQANTAILIFARIENPPRYCQLGEGPPVTYSEPPDESYVHGDCWYYGFVLATISRQTEILDTLRQIPSELFRQSSTKGTRATYIFEDFIRVIAEERHYSKHPAFIAYEEHVAKNQGKFGHGKALRDLSVPWIEVLRQLESGDEGHFNAAIIGALELHKKYWSSTEKLRNNSNGFVSLQLTAAAVQAWDRGMRFDVESDYIPTSWVRGDLFKSKS